MVSYQFPELKNERYDSDWLRIRFRVVHPRGEWTGIASSLFTWEVTGLSEWFDTIANGDAIEPEIGFIEPNLLFRLVDDVSGGKCLRVYFEIEWRPPWARSHTFPDWPLLVEFPLQEIDLRTAAAVLREDLKSYPQRAEY
ncbi:MAG: hypothetical protein EXR47_03785 [Dehalococcoidia bacterium]|nr:hypothetical protein [Dehalococcoidia bacterium]